MNKSKAILNVVPVSENVFNKLETLDGKVREILSMDVRNPILRNTILNRLDSIYNNDLSLNDVVNIFRGYGFTNILLRRVFNCVKKVNKGLLKVGLSSNTIIEQHKPIDVLILLNKFNNSNTIELDSKNPMFKRNRRMVDHNVKKINDVLYVKFNNDDIENLLAVTYSNETIDLVLSLYKIYLDIVLDHNGDVLKNHNDKDLLELTNYYIQLRLHSN